MQNTSLQQDEESEIPSRKGGDRELTFTQRDFNFIRELVFEKAGIVLSEVKQDMVYGRLSRRIRKLGFAKFSDYCELLKNGDEEELGIFINAMTTNLTSFFRENHHFEYLGNNLLPHLFKTKQDRRVRIWSAGCSTGEEPYCLAMVVKETLPKHAQWDVKILATDLDTNVLEHGRRGVYTAERVAGIDKARLKRWFRKGRGDHAGFVRIAPELGELITFKQLNLMQPWPMSGPFDIIFCRNVVIYFDKPTQKILFDRYSDILADDGHLFLGHSESMYKVSDRFELIGKTIYQNLNGKNN